MDHRGRASRRSWRKLPTNGDSVAPWSCAISFRSSQKASLQGYAGLVSIVIDGHKTSVSLEDAFWDDLKEIAHDQGATLSALVAKIDETRAHGNLSSAIRLFVLEHRRNGYKRT